jgi:hypothetical protein
MVSVIGTFTATATGMWTLWLWFLTWTGTSSSVSLRSSGIPQLNGSPTRVWILASLWATSLNSSGHWGARNVATDFAAHVRVIRWIALLHGEFWASIQLFHFFHLRFFLLYLFRFMVICMFIIFLTTSTPFKFGFNQKVISPSVSHRYPLIAHRHWQSSDLNHWTEYFHV